MTLTDTAKFDTRNKQIGDGELFRVTAERETLTPETVVAIDVGTARRGFPVELAKEKIVRTGRNVMRHTMGRLSSVLVVAGLCGTLLLSCGGGANTPLPTKPKIGTLFGGDGASPHNVYAMSIFDDGTLAPVPGSPFAADARTDGLVAAPSFHLLFVSCYASFLNQSMSVFTISSNGKLSSTGPPISAYAYTLSLTADENFLLAGNTIFRVNGASSGLSQLGNVPVNGGSGVFSPDGHFVLVVGGGSSNLDSYSFDQTTGAVQLTSSISGFFMTLPSPPVIHPSSKFVYVPYSSGNVFPGPPPPGGIAGFTLASDGRLTPLPSSPFASGLDFGSGAGQPSPFLAAVIDPQGRHLYAKTATAVYGFNIDQTSGALSPMGGAYPFFTSYVDNPLALTFDASGQFLFMFLLRLVPGGIESYLNSYSVGADGVPHLVPGGPFHMGNHVSSMVAVP